MNKASAKNNSKTGHGIAAKFVAREGLVGVIAVVGKVDGNEVTVVGAADEDN